MSAAPGQVRGSRADLAPLPRRSREKSRRCLDDVHYHFDAWRRAAGPEEIRRGRTTASQGLPGAKAADGPDTRAVSHASPDRGRGAAGAAVRHPGEEGRGGELAQGAGIHQEAPVIAGCVERVPVTTSTLETP